MTTATLERNQEKVLRAQQQKKGRSKQVNLFSFDDYKTERRDAAKAKMAERRSADETNKAIDALINRWLDDAWAAGLNGIVIDHESVNGAYQAIWEVDKWLENTGRGRIYKQAGDCGTSYRLVLFPNKAKKNDSHAPQKHELPMSVQRRLNYNSRGLANTQNT